MLNRRSALRLVSGLALLAAAGCASQPTLPLESYAPWANRVPQFQGQIAPIAEPVTVRYAPHPAAKYRTANAWVLSDRGQAYGQRKTIEGTRRVDRAGNNLASVFLPERIEYAVIGRSASLSLPMTIAIAITDRGQVLETNITAPGVDIGNLQQELHEVYREGFPRISAGPTREGETLVEATVRVTDKNMRQASATYDGILRGRTQHNGRDTLVVEIVGRLLSDLTQGRVQGYALIDSKTGAWVYYEVYTASRVSDWGKTLDLYTREVAELSLSTAAW